jgi:hypothetical protein
MNNNLYSSVYRNLEREFVSLSNLIHINDEQLKIYSIKITELLIRTVVEVESISKELYFLNDGDKNDDKELFFDTDCLELLENKWKISKKVIFISSTNLYFDLDDNKILKPLKKANKRGSSSSEWLRAYQAVKHNRGKNLKKGNLKNLIRALGGLYILNIYYRDVIFQLGKDETGTNFDSSLGSELFSVKTHINHEIRIHKNFTIHSDYDECIYIIKATDETRKDIQNLMKEFSDEANKRIEKNLNQETQKIIKKLQGLEKEDVGKNLDDEMDKLRTDYTHQVARENGQKFKQKYETLRYEGILNKQQF